MREVDIDTPEGMKIAIDWQTNLCENISEGGKWVVPRNNPFIQSLIQKN